MSLMLKKYDYAWLMNKIDWKTMIFSHAHQSTLLFNMSSLQKQYWQNYQALHVMKNDFIFIQDICNDLQQLSYHSQRCMKLLQLLDDVCLQFFYKKIFLYIKHHSHDVWILSHYENIALADEIVLTWSSLQQTLKISEKDLCVIWDNNMHVWHINVLFAWLWDWNDDTENAKSEWLHWN